MENCQHKNGTIPDWTYSTCKDCGAVLTDGGWGVARFRNLAEADQQLQVAAGYAGLVQRRLSREIGLVGTSGFYPNIDRAIGFAQCQVQNRQERAAS